MSRAFFFASSSACIATILGALGCSSQADTAYRGEPLATVSGAIHTEGAVNVPPSVDAAIVWAQVQFAPNAQLVESVEWVGESTPVTGQFPANFTLNIYEPPPSTVLIQCADASTHMAFGFLVAVNGSVDITTVDPFTAIVGQARDSMLLYLDSDRPAGWSCFPDMGFTFAPTKGFHLMQQLPSSMKVRYAGASYPAYVEAPDGLATHANITIGSAQGPSAGSAGVGGFGADAPQPATVDGCLSACLPKASSCGAPSAEAASACSALCATNPDANALVCLQSSACEDLRTAMKAGETICGLRFSISSK